jgi:hypothetical protein
VLRRARIFGRLREGWAYDEIARAGAEGGERKNALGGPRKSLKRLEPDKESKLIPLLSFGRAWLDLARFG